VEGNAPIYQLSYARDMIRDVYSKVKSGEEGFIQLDKWRAY